MKTVLVGFQCDPRFKAQLVAAAGGQQFSQFLRDALVARLRADGFDVPDELAKAPSRLGKGGPKKKKRVNYADEPEPRTVTLDEEPRKK